MNKKSKIVDGLIIIAIMIIIGFGGFAYGSAKTHQQYKETEYCEKTADPLGWTDSNMYTIIENYQEEKYPYINNDTYDCDHIHAEMAHRLKLAGYNASVIIVTNNPSPNESTYYHAILEVPIWIDYGRIVTPGIEYTYDSRFTKEQIKEKIIEHEENFPQERIKYERGKKNEE